MASTLTLCSGAQWSVPCAGEAAPRGQAGQHQHAGEDGGACGAVGELPGGGSVLPQEPHMDLVLVSRLCGHLTDRVTVLLAQVHTFCDNRPYGEGPSMLREHNHFHNGHFPVHRSGFCSLYRSTISKAYLYQL